MFRRADEQITCVVFSGGFRLGKSFDPLSGFASIPTFFDPWYILTQKDVDLVIGGSGFLGRHIVSLGGQTLDIVQRYDVPYCGRTCIVRLAWPQGPIFVLEQYWKVNVNGTTADIAAAQESKLVRVYTSSAGVAFSGLDVFSGPLQVLTRKTDLVITRQMMAGVYEVHQKAYVENAAYAHLPADKLAQPPPLSRFPEKE
ncbi:hypothetical protein BDZ89DRAFT_1108169 [Hymenopellis radicata]|nr:hypothetical protein BDZ89DRAFT_1108169 [Hymenopellis radicata]